jgi:SAM-dependent methyltransferase
VSSCTHPVSSQEILFPADDYVTGDHFEIRRCGRCGLAFTWPSPEPAAMGRYYPDAYYGGAGEKRFTGPVEAAQRLLYGPRARRVERLAGGRPGRVLDVGCGRGFLLDAFRRRGWSAEGTELSEASSRHAREVLGLRVHLGTVQELGLPAGSFDAVTIWHVLEHVTDPGAVLAEVHRLLRPGGALLVAVPNFGSLEARATRAGWFHLDVPRHLLQFTPATLRGALSEAGFVEAGASWFAPEYDAFSFVQSAENRLGLRANLLYDLLRGRKARFHAGHGAGSAVLAWLLAVPLGLLSLPLTLAAGLAGQGATLTLAARRP